MSDHGLSDPDACESRKDIEISLSDEMITISEGFGNWEAMPIENFLSEIEQRCQDSLHNIFDEAKERSNYIFESLADICRPDPVSSYMRDLIEDNSRSDADPGL
jgi:hypothetical protein